MRHGTSPIAILLGGPLAIGLVPPAAAEPLAFDGALGFAAHARGGRGGRVVIVDTVENVVDEEDGLTSLREAVERHDGARYIVFDVGGVFDLGDEKLTLAGEGGSNVTIACQSAPDPGVVIRGPGVNIENGAHDVVMRHCRIRATDWGDPNSTAGRAITVAGGGTRDILLDHLSLSWSTDENFQVYLDANQTADLANVTLSRSIVAEGDADSSHPLSVEHPEWGYHAMGPSCNNNNGTYRPVGCSIVNNFIAHNSSRNGMIWGGAGEISNNIVYNWYGVGITARPQSGSAVDARIVNNLFKPGPDTSDQSTNPGCGDPRYRCALYAGTPAESDPPAASRLTIADNWYVQPEDGKITALSVDDEKRSDVDWVDVPGATASDVDVRSLAAADSAHLACVGASRPVRDAIDRRLIDEFHAGEGSVGIGANPTGSEHDSVEQRDWSGYPGPTARPASHDTDRDGMDDGWERRHGLDPSDPDDHGRVTDGEIYPAIERYLSSLAECDGHAGRDSLMGRIRALIGDRSPSP